MENAVKNKKGCTELVQIVLIHESHVDRCTRCDGRILGLQIQQLPITVIQGLR